MDSAISPFRFPALVVMGVSGCGKSSVGASCARALGWRLHEGDIYHSPESIAKMRAGTPLTDTDRSGWLDCLANLLARTPPAGPGVVLTCSALRRRYRDRLRQALPGLGFVFLQLDYAQALARVQARPGHFFSPTLVADQFATLESPADEPCVLALDALRPVPELSAQVVAWARGTAASTMAGGGA
ncbi:carbohydrate kinase [Acidovorax sp. SRB_14]|uniref:gluconokinase n=1 Tax=unclassified Acidovorax TaxID=2684926 RepID=UPI00197CBF8F|nr:MULTISPECIES: gluconokinase, GntK/IdnK-type [unclassified Acidovorax]NMM78423.1 carbohydrate kinase [Acidovorax sp. SRB_24]NMM78448.1 carbohydrate kinase [Acidovorax sp. SRB_24]NMM79443.1 carbohydrate kinase [Acidovorax sp. SRB_14]NMM84695.1 carbohydrate kinase [Rhodococcus sp. SRB_17]